jgi:hypothetical protein
MPYRRRNLIFVDTHRLGAYVFSGIAMQAWFKRDFKNFSLEPTAHALPPSGTIQQLTSRVRARIYGG